MQIIIPIMASIIAIGAIMPKNIAQINDNIMAKSTTIQIVIIIIKVPPKIFLSIM